MKLSVVFLKHVRPYNTGDKAGFEREEAEDLVRRKLAAWDERLNPDGKHLPHDELHPDIRKHREAIEEADRKAGLTPAARAAGVPVAQAVPEPEQVVEKGSSVKPGKK